MKREREGEVEGEKGRRGQWLSTWTRRLENQSKLDNSLSVTPSFPEAGGWGAVSDALVYLSAKAADNLTIISK